MAGTAKSTLLLLRAFVKTYRQVTFDFFTFVTFVKKYVDQYGAQYKQLQVFVQDTREVLKDGLEFLAGKGQCRLKIKDGEIEGIEYPQYVLSMLRKAYTEMEATPEIPFPQEDSLSISIPDNLISVLDVQHGLANLLHQSRPEVNPIIKLIFPDNLGSIIVTPDRLPRQLLEDSIHKVRLYLAQGNNASYIHSRLRPGFQSSQNILTEMIKTVIVKPQSVVDSFIESSDLTFRFWANLSNLINKEYKEKTDILALERSYCQAAHILSILNIFYREFVKNKSDETQNTLKEMDSKLKSPPYAFTLSDLINPKESGGKPALTDRTKEALLKFLENKTRPTSKQLLPDLLRIKAADGQEYYLYKELIPPLFVQQLSDATNKVETHYINSWSKSLWQDQEPESMKKDAAFLQDLAQYVAESHPLFSAILNYSLLTGVEKETTISHDLVPHYDRCLDRRNFRLKPLDDILKTNRKQLVKETKAQLPFWGKIKILRKLGLLLSRLFKGGSRRSREMVTHGRHRSGTSDVHTGVSPRDTGAAGIKGGSSSSAKVLGKKSKSRAVDSSVAYKKAILALKEHFVGKN
ncbi:MAG TPA: hypothetical protein VMX75_00140, partial [Spirochaetia bacterium]|nr:hypothetical protein [Spirochaetia bacterium]